MRRMLSGLVRYVQRRAEGEAGFRRLVERGAALVGYDLRRPTRVGYREPCRALIRDLGPAGLDVCEVSAADNADWQDLGFRSYRNLDWPDFDVCEVPLRPELRGQFDLVIADQVFEHLLWPYRAGRNVFEMLRPGGHALLMTPFLIRIHGGPQDCSRWTPIGMRHLLAECGFPLEHSQAWSWGDRRTVRDALVTWPRMGWRREPLANEPLYPLVVWTLARKPAEATA
jgi:SAM-dependent methyltransferase